MPTTENLTDEAITGHITRAVNEVFTTMFGFTPDLKKTCSQSDDDVWSPATGNDGVNTPHVVGTVGFIGEVNGLIYLYLPDGFAKVVTCKMLGFEESDLGDDSDEVVNDAIGELTNMTVGVFKNALSDSGFSCRLTIPSILRGSNFCIEPIKSATRRIYVFDCGGHRLVVDILMKIGD